MDKELQIFQKHTSGQGLKHSQKRDVIVRTFLNTKKHVSAEDLHKLAREMDPAIGFTTVYRTLKLIVESGLGEMVDFNDGVRRFERKIGREYHAHFICSKCGDNFEIFDENIKKLSARLSTHAGFQAQKHRLEIFGLCKECR